MKSRVLLFAGLLLAASVMQAQPAFAADHFAAFAFASETGAMGWSASDNASQGDAEDGALSECGPGCEIVLWFKNACGAIATAPNHAYGTAWRNTREDAEEAAMHNCDARASNCRIRHWLCTPR
jgi:serine/threonine-protein kinase